MRRILNQIVWAAARSRDTHFQKLFRRFVPRMGIQKALWAVAHHLLRVLWKILHHDVHYIEYGRCNSTPQPAHKRTIALEWTTAAFPLHFDRGTCYAHL